MAVNQLTCLLTTCIIVIFFFAEVFRAVTVKATSTFTEEEGLKSGGICSSRQNQKSTSRAGRVVSRTPEKVSVRLEDGMYRTFRRDRVSILVNLSPDQ